MLSVMAMDIIMDNGSQQTETDLPKQLITFKISFPVYEKQELWLHLTSSDFFHILILVLKNIGTLSRTAAIMQYNLILYTTFRQ